jgi:hypothetical protein
MSCPAPIFVGGFYKSGTSLLRALISQSPEIAGGLETYWFAVDWENQKGRGEEPLEKWLKRMAAFFSVPEDRVNSIAEDSQSGASFLDNFMAEVAARQGKSRWVEKTSGNCLYSRDILTQWPDAKILNIYRDPRDVYAANLEAFRSQGEAPWVENDFVETWLPFVEVPVQLREEGVLTKDNFLEVCYENLVSDIHGTMRKVAEFVGDVHVDAMSHFSGRSQDFGKVAEVTGKKSTTLQRLSQPLTKERVGISSRLAKGELEKLEQEFRAAGIWETYIKHQFHGT